MQRKTKIKILVAFYIASAIFGVMVAFFSRPICLTEQCVDKSTFMLSKMLVKGVDPCKDYYKYVCGSGPINIPDFAENSTRSDNFTVVPSDTGTIYHFMVKRIVSYAANLRLEDSVIKDLLFHESLLRKFLVVCAEANKETDVASNDDIRVLFKLSVEGTGMYVGDIFSKKLLNHSFTPGMFEHNLKLLGFPGRHFFTSAIKTDTLKNDEIFLHIARADSFSTITHEYFSSKTPDQWAELFKEFANYFVPSSNDINGKEMKELMGQVVQLWFDMYKVLQTEESKTVSGEYTPWVKLDELQKSFPDLDFAGFLKSMGAKHNEKRYVYVEEGSHNYFHELKKVMRKYSRQVKLVYQFVSCVMDVAPFVSFSSDISAALESIQSLNSASDICSKYMGNRFGGMMLSLVIERFNLTRNPPDGISYVYDYFSQVMKEELEKASWMDSKTKTMGASKLKMMKTLISMTKRQFDSLSTSGRRAAYFNGLCIQRTVLATIFCTNKFFTVKSFGLFTREILGFDQSDQIPMGDIVYDQYRNMFEVPMVILRFPAFDVSWPFHINFGGMGIDISAELLKGFDYGGSHHDRFGITNLWWTNTTMDRYKHKEVECSKIMRPLTSNKTSEKHAKVPDVRQLTEEQLQKGELMKSYWRILVAVRMSHKAYKLFKKEHSSMEHLLPGLEHFTVEKNFFLAHAHMRCYPPTADEKEKKYSHLYFQALTTMKEFKDAFKCRSTPTNKMAAILDRASRECTLY